MKTKFLVFVFLFACLRLTAQPPEVIYEGTLVKSGFDNNTAYGPFNIGFNFTFFGNTYSQFYLSTNGLITFGSGSTDATEDPIPTAATPNNFIAAFWDDLNIDPSGNIQYASIGAAPNRKLIVQFKNMGFYTGPTYLGTFAVILYETTNNIQVQFRLIVLPSNTRAHGGDATIGLENSDGSAGVQYSYHNTSAITNEQAISFTPNGSTYDINSNATYDGIYLTTNILLPVPGITQLISPAVDGTIGTTHTFSWSESSYATNYSLRISTSSNLSSPTTYDAGTNLSYEVSGLTEPTTYYWGVFASNATGTTWCEIRRFYTSSTPPLTPIPQTIWTEQNQDKTIKLQYSGGDASPKTAIITSLPAQGQIYQYNAGARGAQITSFPTTVTDASMNVIYAASGSTGNGVGNFNFKINDAGGDSPEAAVTVNVSPPGIPNVLRAAKSTTWVEIQLDRPMTDPAGKQAQFEVKIDGSPVTPTSAALKNLDNYTVVLNLGTTLTGTETVLISYTQGDVTSAAGGYLLSFTDYPAVKTAQTITFTQSLNRRFDQSPDTITAVPSSGLGLTYTSSNTAVMTFSTYKMTYHSIGSSVITLRQAGNATYQEVRAVRTLTVSKGEQTITFSALPAKTFGDADFNLSATASSGLTVSYVSSNPAVATVAGTLVHIVGAGSADIIASQAGNTNWNAAPDVTRTLTVNKAAQTITFDPLPAKTFGDADFALTATASSSLPVSFVSDNPAVAEVNAGTVHIVGAGTANITASQPGNDNYNAATPVIQPLTVNKASQTITFNPLASKTYGDADFSPGATSTSGLTVSYASDNTSVASIVSGMIHIAGAGSAVITASQSGDANYLAASDVPRTLTVGKAVLTLTADDKSKEYLAPLPELTFTATGFVNGDTESVIDILPTIQTTATESSAVGTYPITLSGGSDDNYSFTLVDGTLTVTKISQTVTFTRIPEKLMVSDTFRLKAISSSGLPVLFESLDISKATVSGDILTGVFRGDVQVRAYSNGDDNYQSAESLTTVEIISTHKDVMNLFTPNGDGFNDYWELPMMAEWGRCNVKVYNRWGKLVFDNPDYDNLWDGTSNGNPLPEGAYYYVIRTGNAGVVKGTVNIVR